MTTPPPPPSSLPQHRPTRRTVARGAAWSVPVVVVGAAAPVAAASPCPPWHYVLAWADQGTTTYDRDSATSATATVTSLDAGAPAVTVTLTAVATEPSKLDVRFDNLEVNGTPVGGTAEYGLVVRQVEPRAADGSPPGPAARQELTFAFDHAVSNLSFTVTDIDSSLAGTNFIDAVAIDPDPSSVSIEAPTHVQGGATVASPLQATQANHPVDDETSADGNATVTLAGPLTSFRVLYWNATRTPFPPSSTVIQSVYLTNISFVVAPAEC